MGLIMPQGLDLGWIKSHGAKIFGVALAALHSLANTLKAGSPNLADLSFYCASAAPIGVVVIAGFVFYRVKQIYAQRLKLLKKRNEKLKEFNRRWKELEDSEIKRAEKLAKMIEDFEKALAKLLERRQHLKKILSEQCNP